MKNKVIVIDTSTLWFPTVFSWERQIIQKNESNSDRFIMPPHAVYFNSLLSCLKKIGVEKDDVILLATEGKSWRKSIAGYYKAQRADDREKHKLIDWDKQFNYLNKVNEALNEATNWHLIREWNSEADDVLAVACRFYKDKEVILVTGDCLSGLTKIKMADGSSKLLRNIKEGDKVISYDEKNKKFVKGNVIKKHKKTHNKEYHIYYENIKTPIRSSSNHKFLTTDGWKKACELKKGNTLYHLNKNIFPYNNLQNNYKIGYILGLAVGDGHIDYKHSCISYEICDIEPLKRIQKYVKELFNYNIIIKKSKTTTSEKQAYRVRLYLNYNFDYLMKYKDKKSDNFKKGYCAGFFDAEGSKSESKLGIQLSFYQNGYKTLEELKQYFKKLDIKTTNIFKSSNKCNKFCINNVESLKFFQICKPAIKRKYPNWKNHYGFLQNGKKIKKIKIINQKNKRPFFHYDLSIFKYHNYVIEGNIIVHNCDLKQLCYYDNVRYFNVNKKCKGSKGLYERVDKPLKIIADKVRLGDISDNIIVDKLNDTENDAWLRHKIINLLELPEEIEKAITDILANLSEKELDLDKLPKFKNVKEKFLKIYDKEKIITPEYCYQLLEKREAKKKKKASEKAKLKREQKKKEKK